MEKEERNDINKCNHNQKHKLLKFCFLTTFPRTTSSLGTFSCFHIFINNFTKSFATTKHRLPSLQHLKIVFSRESYTNVIYFRLMTVSPLGNFCICQKRLEYTAVTNKMYMAYHIKVYFTFKEVQQ